MTNKFKIVSQKKKAEYKNAWISAKSKHISDIKLNSKNFIHSKDRVRIPFKNTDIYIYIKKDCNHHLFNEIELDDSEYLTHQNTIAFDIFCILCELFSPNENPFLILRGISGHMVIKFKNDEAFKKFKSRIK
jgi:hypothetical protein